MITQDGRVRRAKWKATTSTAHTVTVNSLIESNKQTNILVRPRMLSRRLDESKPGKPRRRKDGFT
jgi:hypothetical protein